MSKFKVGDKVRIPGIPLAKTVFKIASARNGEALYLIGRLRPTQWIKERYLTHAESATPVPQTPAQDALTRLHNDTLARIEALPSYGATKPMPCRTHKPKEYVGLIQRWMYCEVCDERLS